MPDPSHRGFAIADPAGLLQPEAAISDPAANMRDFRLAMVGIALQRFIHLGRREASLERLVICNITIGSGRGID